MAEKNFLHDLATPLAIATFLMDMLVEEMGEMKSLTPDQEAKMNDVIQSLKQMGKLIEGRRDLVKKRGHNDAA